MARRFRNLLGPNIRLKRMQLGLTQDDLAARLQLAGLDYFDRVTVAKVESQIRSLYDFELVAVAKALEADLGDLSAVTSTVFKKALPRLIEGER